MFGVWEPASGSNMSAIDLAAFERTPLSTSPFDHLVLPGFVRAEALPALLRDFPAIDRAGSYPVTALDYGPAFAALLDELRRPELAHAMAGKFGLDLAGRPTMITVRGRVRARDGRIHTDSEGKLITVLIYLNEAWEAPGGRLRLLDRPDDLDAYAVEVPPDAGTLLAFRCSEHAWHGHKPVDGVRRSIQLNWVRDKAYLRREELRHLVSAILKRLPRRLAS